MPQWIPWTEFMQPQEAARFRKEKLISQHELDLLPWVRDERQGHPVYLTDIYNREVRVWREPNGQLVWDSIYFEWIAESQIDQLHSLLKARGFIGTRTDEITPARHLVTFQQEKFRLDIHASRREYKTLTELAELADDFMRHDEHFEITRQS